MVICEHHLTIILQHSVTLVEDVRQRFDEELFVFPRPFICDNFTRLRNVFRLEFFVLIPKNLVEPTIEVLRQFAVLYVIVIRWVRNDIVNGLILQFKALGSFAPERLHPFLAGGLVLDVVLDYITVFFELLKRLLAIPLSLDYLIEEVLNRNNILLGVDGIPSTGSTRGIYD